MMYRIVQEEDRFYPEYYQVAESKPFLIFFTENVQPGWRRWEWYTGEAPGWLWYSSEADAKMYIQKQVWKEENKEPKTVWHSEFPNLQGRYLTRGEIHGAFLKFFLYFKPGSYISPESFEEAKMNRMESMLNMLFPEVKNESQPFQDRSAEPGPDGNPVGQRN